MREERKAILDEQINRLRAFRDTIPADRPLAIGNCDRAIDDLLAEKDALTQAREAEAWQDEAAPDTLAAGLAAAGYGSGGIL
jgi:hypothetical protein